VPSGFRLPKPDEQGWWPHGSTRIERAYRPVGYITKYASKGVSDDSRLPRHARLYGVGTPTGAERFATRRAALARWLRESTQGVCKRIARVGWVDTESGSIHRTPFRLLWTTAAGMVSLTIVDTRRCSA
jgi:hypothetical protein